MSWRTNPKETGTETITTTLPETKIKNSEDVKITLMRQLMPKLMSKVIFSKSYNANDPFDPYVYSAEITIADRRASKIIVSENVFVYKEQIFDTEKIEKALFNTYPELFL